MLRRHRHLVSGFQDLAFPNVFTTVTLKEWDTLAPYFFKTRMEFLSHVAGALCLHMYQFGLAVAKAMVIRAQLAARL